MDRSYNDPREGTYEQLLVHRPPGSSEYLSGPWSLVQMGAGGPLVFVHDDNDNVLPEHSVLRAFRKKVAE